MIITQKHKEKEILFMVEEVEEGGYVARSFHHRYIQADILDEFREMVLDAVVCHFDDDETLNLINSIS